MTWYPSNSKLSRSPATMLGSSSTTRILYRKCDGEFAALAGRALHPNFTAMGFYNVTHQREPKSTSFRVMHQWIARPIKLLKDLGLFVRRNANSVINNLEIDTTVASIETHSQIFVGDRILHSVIHEIQKRSRNGLAVHL